MKRNILILILPFLLCSCGKKLQENAGRMDFVSQSDITFDDGFWRPFLYIHKDVTLPVCVDWAERHIGSSLVSKAVEGVGYSLQFESDPELSVRRSSLVSHLKGETGVHLLSSDSCSVSNFVSTFFNNARYLQLSGDGKFADDLELTLLNKVLPCLSLKGDRFSDDSPISSSGGFERQTIDNNPLAALDIFRALPSVGNYIYGTSKDALWVNLFIGGKANVKLAGEEVSIHQTTSYPWDGYVALTLEIPKPVKAEVRIRIPSWCEDFTLTVNDNVVDKMLVDAGYVVLARKWQDGDKIEIILDMPVEVEDSGFWGEQEDGKRLLMRGPFVYCVEEADNPESFDSLYFSDGLKYRLENLPKQKWWGHELTRISAQLSDARPLILLPYFAWGNRKPGKMAVFIPYHAD